MSRHFNNPKVEQQNMVLTIINLISLNITKIMLVIDLISPTKKLL